MLEKHVVRDGQRQESKRSQIVQIRQVKGELSSLGQELSQVAIGYGGVTNRKSSQDQEFLQSFIKYSERLE